ncbi:MAG: hypothetical protein UT94_C0046G0001, partial [Candidatus Uhrbacteria bacterium GW2011_GWF2_40_263]
GTEGALGTGAGGAAHRHVVATHPEVLGGAPFEVEAGLADDVEETAVVAGEFAHR